MTAAQRKNGTVSIQVLKNQRIIAEKTIVAERFFVRMKGLMGVRHLEQGTGMLFPRCKSVHMWGMSTSLDIVFLRWNAEASQYEVTSTHENIKPWKLFPLTDWRATETLELPPGSVARALLQRGDLLCIS